MLSLPPTVFSSSTRPGRRSAQKSFRRGTGLIPSFSNFCKRPDGSYFGASSFSMALSTDWTVFRSSTVLYIASLFFFCSEMLESFLAGSRFDSSSHPGSICRTCPLFPPGCAEPAPKGDRRYQSRSKKQNVAEQKIPPAESAGGMEVGLESSGAEDALAPQLGQNIAPDGISLPQLEQNMMRLLSQF